MLFQLICVGKLKEKFYEEKIQDYIRKINFDAKIQILEIKDSTKEKESEKIFEVLTKEKNFVVILSEEGKEFTSREFANFITTIPQKITFIIGGPFGMTTELRQRGNVIISLSKMTFTHEMVRLFFAEQLFRAISIIKNRKYHND